MKNITALLLILTLFACSGQPAEKRLYKLHYENSRGEKGVTTFLYDESGRNYKCVWTLLDGSRFSFNYHYYDDDGNFVRKYREFSDGLTSENQYRYDTAGNLVRESFERSDGVQGEASYVCDTDGKRLSADCDGLNGWFHGEIEYTHNAAGNRIGATISRDGNHIGRIKYNYDADGNLLTEQWEMGDWNQIFTCEYEPIPTGPPKSYVSSNVFIHNTKQHCLTGENYNYSNESGGPSFFEYDDSGKLLKKIFERSDGLRTETVFTYDDKGLLIESVRKHHDRLITKFRYNFNDDRRMVSRIMERSDGETGREWYEYNEEGRLVSGVYDNFDYWLNGKLRFVYENGRLAKGEFKGEDGFDAEITFNTGESGNPDTIHWEFSFGKTQTYTFRYVKTQ